MKCNKGPIKCLGFNFGTIWAECDKLDIEKKDIHKCDKQISSWITKIRKITIVKSLIIPNLAY